MTTTTTQTEDEALEKIADDLQGQRELAEATLDGLDARIDMTLATIDGYDIDGKMATADDDVAGLAEDVMHADVNDMKELDSVIAEADTEEDKLLEDDELDPETTGAKLTPEDTGMNE